MSDLSKLLDEAEKIMEIHFLMTGECGMPVWVSEQEDGKKGLFFTPFENPESKERVLQHMKEQFKLTGVVRYVFIAEVWAAVGPKEGGIPEIPEGGVKEIPGRKELVMITGEDKLTGEGLARTREIIRGAGSMPTLGPAETIDLRLSTGQFVNIFDVSVTKH